MPAAITERKRSSATSESKDSFKLYLKESGVVDDLWRLYDTRNVHGEDPLRMLKKSIVETETSDLRTRNNDLECENGELQLRVEFLEERMRLMGMTIPNARPVLKNSKSSSVNSSTESFEERRKPSLAAASQETFRRLLADGSSHTFVLATSVAHAYNSNDHRHALALPEGPEDLIKNISSIRKPTTKRCNTLFACPPFYDGLLKSASAATLNTWSIDCNYSAGSPLSSATVDR
ncbi:hypothetical protein, variant [Sphaeroforma arctica JP610]|uniref:Uncharacterized protein n=1 Tax=Sphaeroforma arctica JP610 TaxID=667725 RepID=A0A0L0FIW7_9EUKA|nr:hypothetical protein, variant [Sphaeroforma arctica JP610]KNC76416.1 hypothetical protein, variant [Sphaeroforma arctica JP610]|eukprot:XP_014150318.1 hypothetical protein, variant [Sphaeroforma arctica JP610]